MNKDKQINEMVRIFFNVNCFPPISCEECKYNGRDCCADYLAFDELVNAGYGNVKQAVKEFAEKLKEKLEHVYCPNDSHDYYQNGVLSAKSEIKIFIDELVKEHIC